MSLPDNQPRDIAAFEDVGGLSAQKQGPGNLLTRITRSSAFEDLLTDLQGGVPAFNLNTFDQWGAPHFTSTSGDLTVFEAYLYDARADEWADPVSNEFTGFAKDGTQYIAGEQVPGPVRAPWSSETQSVNRSPRQDFPDRALLVIARGAVGELVIFDLDAYDGNPPSLVVWMRFVLGTAGGTFLMLGRNNTSLSQVHMHNGVLVVASTNNGLDPGGVFILDFRVDGAQNAVQLVRSDDHYRLLAGRNITNRNDNSSPYTNILDGAAVDLLVGSDFVFRAYVQTSREGSGNKTWIVMQGDDADDPSVLVFVDALSTQQFKVIGDDLGTSDDNDYFKRNTHLDRDGWLWVSLDNKLWRVGRGWKSGRLFQFKPYTSTSSRLARLQRGVELPLSIRWLASAGEYIFAATDDGVYAVHRGTLRVHHAFSISTKLGQGLLPSQSRQGRVIPGGNPQVYKLNGFDLAESSFLLVACDWRGVVEDTAGVSGGVAVIRLSDGSAPQSLVFPGIPEDGAFINMPLWNNAAS